ncbi:MAG: M24 family metallopeptidase [Pseudomonadota bacterium]
MVENKKLNCICVALLMTAGVVLGACSKADDPVAETPRAQSAIAADASLSTMAAAASAPYNVPGARERFDIQRDLIGDKLNRALLPAMRKHGIDLWLVLDREYNPDPLQRELGGNGTGVRAAYLFFDNGSNEPEKLFYSSHEQPKNSVIANVYDETIYYGYSPEGLTPHLRKAIAERDPKRIGINRSATIPMADGLSSGLNQYLLETLEPKFTERLVSAELLARDFRTNRTDRENAVYEQLLEWSHRWMEEALSTANIETGTTTAEDVAWWLKDRARELGLSGYGTVRVVREGDLLPIHDPDLPLLPGDIVGIDGGLIYLGYSVDIKRTAYLLRPGETAVPEELRAAWEVVHDMATVYTAQMMEGAVGTEIWSAINAEASARGYATAGPDAGGDAVSDTRPEAGFYGHSVGNGAHDIGARVAADIPFAYGDRVRYPLAMNEWVSIEFHVSTPIPMWGGKTWYTRFEETAQITPKGTRWMLAPQRELFLVEPSAD